MSTWAVKRRLIYFLSVSGFLLLVVAIPLFLYLYKPATCTDGIQNQAEGGIDCGGSCPLLCSTEVLPVIVHWQRFFEVSGIYSAVAYVENPNTGAGAAEVPYSFKFIDEKNRILYERTGKANIPPHKKFAIFEHTIAVPLGKPTKVFFEFAGTPVWNRNYPPEPIIPVIDEDLRDVGTKPQLFATIVNPFVYPLTDVEVTALIYDTNGNVIAVSQTYVDKILKDGSERAVFTWPQPFVSESRSCDAPADIMLILDRSGSMDDDGADPPQPLTDVKNAAKAFIGQLKTEDQVGVVSFATVASDPPDSELSADMETGKNAVESIAISRTGSQHTNIGDGLEKAGDELKSKRHRSRAKRVMVLLTDGAANLPQADDDPAYPETFAEGLAEKAKGDGTEIYSIGLGSKVNADFLKAVSTSPEHYYAAAKSKDLEGVYGKISSSICKVGPAVITFITRTNGR